MKSIKTLGIEGTYIKYKSVLNKSVAIILNENIFSFKIKTRMRQKASVYAPIQYAAKYLYYIHIIRERNQFYVKRKK